MNEPVPASDGQLSPAILCLPWIGQHSMALKTDTIEAMKKGPCQHQGLYLKLPGLWQEEPRIAYRKCQEV